MNTAYFASPLVLFSEMGYAARLIAITLMGMAGWTVWMAAARADGRKTARRLRYLDALGRTAPLIGFLGTVIGTMNVMIGMTRQATPEWNLLGQGMTEALVTTVFGILIGVAAHWTAALLQAREAVVHHG